MKVLVIGGGWFNGLALVKELVKQGHDVTVLNRGKSAAPLPGQVRRLLADRTDAAALREALGQQEFDCVHDMSAYRPDEVQQVTEILNGRIGHYIFVSSTVTYAQARIFPILEESPLERGERQNAYGRNKIACEEVLVRLHRQKGFPHTIAVFPMVFGPNNVIPEREQRMFIRLQRGRKAPIFGDGTTISHTLHVDDGARAMVAIMGNAPTTIGKRYNVAGPDQFTDEGWVDSFGRVLGVTPEKVFIPAAVMDDLWSGKLMFPPGGFRAQVDPRMMSTDMNELRTYLLTRIVPRIQPVLLGWNGNAYYSTERLRRDTGWRPEYNFLAAVDQTWEWMKANGLDRTAEFDFSFEDRLLAHLDERK